MPSLFLFTEALHIILEERENIDHNLYVRIMNPLRDYL